MSFPFEPSQLYIYIYINVYTHVCMFNCVCNMCVILRMLCRRRLEVGRLERFAAARGLGKQQLTQSRLVYIYSSIVNSVATGIWQHSN
eukprot:COSAG06_NODE_1917_length_8070_cov_51.606323_7_plen_88_part_00